MSIRIALRLTFIFAVMNLAVFPQASRETLTNPKVIQMVRLGLESDIIIDKIRQSQCQFDTSTEALGRLKAAKVPSEVIRAMMNPASGGYSDSPQTRQNSIVRPPDPEPISADSRALRLINQPGIYLFENSKMTEIEPSVYSGSKAGFLGTALTYGIKKTRIRAIVRGKSANTQVSSNRPVFYFVFSRENKDAGAVMSGLGGYAATSPNEFVLLAMAVKNNSREATLGEANAFSMSSGARDSEIREFSFEKVQAGVYKVTPKIDLAAGEYCFHYAGSSSGTKLFDFGVR